MIWLRSLQSRALPDMPAILTLVGGVRSFFPALGGAAPSFSSKISFWTLKPSRIAIIVGAKSARNVNAGSAKVRFVLRFNFFGRCGGLVPRVSSAGGLGFDHGTISGAINLRTMLVHLAKEGGRLKASFCFGVYRFFDQFVPAIELLPALFHLGFH